MIEMLMTVVPKSNPVIPDSGPGPGSLLHSKDDTGVFGLVTLSDFIKFSQIMNSAKVLPNGTVTPDSSSNWYKYYYRGKILYIPIVPAITSTTWNDIYKAGFMYGVDGPGAFPVTGSVTNQLATVTYTDTNGDTWLFKVRSINATVTDPTNDYGTTSRNVLDSEYSTLCERMRPALNVDQVWGNIGSQGGEGISMTTWSSYTTHFIAVGTNINYGIRRVLNKTTSLSWLPVLELIGKV